MAGFVEVGTSPGQALPSPGTAAATLGMHLGANGLWQYPPGYLLGVDLGGAGISNSASETSLLTGALTGGFPAGVAVGDAVHIKAAGTYLNNSGGNQALTLNLYMGTTIIATSVSPNETTSATVRAWQLDVEVFYSIIGGAGVGQIRAIGNMQIATGNGTGFQSLSGITALFYNAAAPATIATNAAAVADLKAQTSNGTATTAVVCNVFRARYFPKNY